MIDIYHVIRSIDIYHVIRSIFFSTTVGHEWYAIFNSTVLNNITLKICQLASFLETLKSFKRNFSYNILMENGYGSTLYIRFSVYQNRIHSIMF